MNYSEEMFLEDDPAPVMGEVACALPDLGRVLVLALAAVVVAGALGAWALRKMRPW